MFALSGLDGTVVGQDAVEVSVLSDTVRQLKTKPPVIVPVDAKLGLALDRMVEHGVGALMVTDEAGLLVGILTERDYLRKVVGVVPDFVHLPVRDYMTNRPEFVGLDDVLALALQKMDTGGYRHLPVVEAGKPIGILSVRDVIRHITKICEPLR